MKRFLRKSQTFFRKLSLNGRTHTSYIYLRPLSRATTLKVNKYIDSHKTFLNKSRWTASLYKKRNEAKRSEKNKETKRGKCVKLSNIDKHEIKSFASG